MFSPRFNVVEVLVVALCLLLAAWDVRNSQFKPRHKIISVNGRVMSDVVLTNPVEVTWTTESYVSTNGIAYRQVARTNVLWTQWNFWK